MDSESRRQNLKAARQHVEGVRNLGKRIPDMHAPEAIANLAFALEIVLDELEGPTGGREGEGDASLRRFIRDHECVGEPPHLGPNDDPDADMTPEGWEEERRPNPETTPHPEDQSDLPSRAPASTEDTDTCAAEPVEDRSKESSTTPSPREGVMDEPEDRSFGAATQASHETARRSSDGDQVAAPPTQHCEGCERLEGAVRWALGESGHFEKRAKGDGPYWWRRELRRRAALTAHEERATPHPDGRPPLSQDISGYSQRCEGCEVVDCLRELVALVDDAAAGDYDCDGFTTQPAKRALTAHEERGDHEGAATDRIPTNKGSDDQDIGQEEVE